MNKTKVKTIFSYAIIALLIGSVFLFFAPMIGFNDKINNQELFFALDGFSLIKNDSYAIATTLQDTYKYQGVLFPSSTIFIALFSLIIIMLVCVLIYESLKKYYKIERYFYPVLSFVALAGLILSFNVLPNYQVEDFAFEYGYGLIILNVLLALLVLMSGYISLITFLNEEKN